MSEQTEFILKLLRPRHSIAWLTAAGDATVIGVVVLIITGRLHRRKSPLPSRENLIRRCAPGRGLHVRKLAPIPPRPRGHMDFPAKVWSMRANLFRQLKSAE